MQTQISRLKKTDLGTIDLAATGYTASVVEGVTEEGPTFLACGSGGRLDRIFADGTLENIPLPVGDKNLTSILRVKGMTLVGGVSGAFAYALDGRDFELVSGVEQEDILGITQFKNRFYACTYSGKLLVSNDGMRWSVMKKLTDKPLIGIAADNNFIMTVTNDSDIFKSIDGDTWDEQNYNELYEGLSESLYFTGILNLNGNFIIFGHDPYNPDAPIVISSSSGGEVWSTGTLRKINNADPGEFYPLEINSACYFGGELMTVCSGGRVLTFTDCPTCNMLVEIKESDLRCISIAQDVVLIAGDNFEFDVLPAKDLRQDRISLEQAEIEIAANGAVVIDVREEEEYKEGHIPGAIYIHADEVEERLTEEVPDPNTVLIFYCDHGSKSQAAMETALDLGYYNAFNLGSIDDWPYEIEVGEGASEEVSEEVSE